MSLQEKIDRLQAELNKLRGQASTKRSRTLIKLVIDESGSMAWQRDTVINSINDYLKSQREINLDDVFVSLTTFNGFVTNRFIGKPIDQVDGLGRFNYSPNGSTALYDAVNASINDCDHDIERLNIDRVLFVVMTDGGENSSKYASVAGVKARLQDRTARGNWTPVYLGANQDAWGVGSMMGFIEGNVGNYQDYGKTMQWLNTSTQSYRGASAMSVQNFAQDLKS